MKKQIEANINPSMKRKFSLILIGEYFRVFVSYGVIALSLAMHAWKRVKKGDDELLLPPSTSGAASSNGVVD